MEWAKSLSYTVTINGRPQRRAVKERYACVCLFHTYYYAQTALRRNRQSNQKRLSASTKHNNKSPAGCTIWRKRTCSHEGNTGEILYVKKKIYRFNSPKYNNLRVRTCVL